MTIFWKRLPHALPIVGMCIVIASCGNFSYEQRHVTNSMMLWSATGDASHSELANAVMAAMRNAPDATTVVGGNPTLFSEIIWHDAGGTQRKLAYSFDLDNGSKTTTGVYFTATYFVGGDTGEKKALDSEARVRLQNLLDDVQRRLGDHAMKSSEGIVLR